MFQVLINIIKNILPSIKIAKIIPIFKKGKARDPSCYRPISLLPVFSKIFEKVLYLQFIDYSDKYKLFDKEQHGFQSGKSTIIAEVDFIETIIRKLYRPRR